MEMYDLARDDGMYNIKWRLNLHSAETPSPSELSASMLAARRASSRRSSSVYDPSSDEIVCWSMEHTLAMLESTLAPFEGLCLGCSRRGPGHGLSVTDVLIIIASGAIEPTLSFDRFSPDGWIDSLGEMEFWMAVVGSSD
uniref:Uncharacterized protein n=1 Tax=Anopheles atroparvus TaxID=41427 RepID=A0A182J3X5_ANOAO